MRWIGRTTGGSSIKVPLDAPSNAVAEAGNASVLLTWTDPPDKYAANEGGASSEEAVLVSQWAYTRVVRKQGSAPVSANDGTLVCESGVRDQYASSPFADSLVENDTLYYYGLYAFTTTGVVSEGAIVSVTPKAFDPILENNTWEKIKEVADSGVAPSAWQVGDMKNITVAGQTMTAVILGFGMPAPGYTTITSYFGKRTSPTSIT